MSIQPVMVPHYFHGGLVDPNELTFILLPSDRTHTGWHDIPGYLPSFFLLSIEDIEHGLGIRPFGWCST